MAGVKYTRGTYNIDNRRNKRVEIAISEQEKSMIDEKAKIKGMSRTDFIVRACESKKVKGYNKKDLYKNNKIE